MSEPVPPQAQAERISDALEGKRRTNGGFRAHCPAHEDQHPSLDIDVKDGKVLVKCRAGCDQERVLEALRERGLWSKAEKPAPPEQPNTPRYWYRDPTGKAIGYKDRHGSGPEKWCEWFLPDGTAGLKGAVPFPYRIERLAKTPKTTPVYIAEGEKCVEALEHLGFVALCGPHGSSTWDAKWGSFLAGYPVVLLPDNDDPGRKHMREVADSVRKRAAWIKWVELSDVPPGGDVADWMLAGGTADALTGMASEARYYAPPTVPRLATLPSMEDVEDEIVQWLWHPYIPVAKLTLMEGDPGTGKSWLTLAVATAISLGAPLPGDRGLVGNPGRVLLLMGEDGYGDTIKPRLRAMGADLSRIRPVVGLYKEGEQQIMMLSPEGILALEVEIEEYRPSMVVVDPLVAYLDAAVDVNRSNEVRGVLRPVGNIAQRYGVAIVGTRHLTKAMHSMALYRGQGSIDFTAISRSVLLVGRDTDDPSRRVVVPSKASLAEEGTAQAFRIGAGAQGGDFLWDGQLVDMTAAKLLTANEQSDEDRSALDEAKVFLTDALFEGPRAAKEVLHAAREAGVAERTLHRAKAALQVKAKKASGHSGQWLWVLPGLPEKTVGNLGNLGSLTNSAADQRQIDNIANIAKVAKQTSLEDEEEPF